LIDFNGYLQYNHSDEEYHYLNKWTVSDYFQTSIDNYDKFASDYIQEIFGYSIAEYESKEILKVLSAAMEWIKEEWNSGMLQFHYDESMPNKLKSFVMAFKSQSLLDGFENL
jgi:hypothetical protein